MKYIHILLIITILCSCKSKKDIVVKPSERYVIIALESKNLVKQNKAYTLGRRLLEACNTSKFIPFSTSEATEKVITNASVAKISETCKKINNRNGKFIDLQLLEVIQDTETDEIIFRYRIDYEKKLYKREIKITVNSENKISAINTKEISKIF